MYLLLSCGVRGLSAGTLVEVFVCGVSFVAVWSVLVPTLLSTVGVVVFTREELSACEGEVEGVVGLWIVEVRVLVLLLFGCSGSGRLKFGLTVAYREDNNINEGNGSEFNTLDSRTGWFFSKVSYIS